MASTGSREQEPMQVPTQSNHPAGLQQEPPPSNNEPQQYHEQQHAQAPHQGSGQVNQATEHEKAHNGNQTSGPWPTFPGSVNVQAANSYNGTPAGSSGAFLPSSMYSPYGPPMYDASGNALYRPDQPTGYPPHAAGFMGVPSPGMPYFGYPAINPYAYFNYSAPGMRPAVTTGPSGPQPGGRRNTWVPPSQYVQQQQNQGQSQPTGTAAGSNTGKELSWRNTSGQVSEQDKPVGRELKHRSSYSVMTSPSGSAADPYASSLLTQQSAALALVKVAQEAAAQQSAKYGNSASNASSPLFPSSPGLATFGQAPSQEALPADILNVLQNGPPVPPPVPSLFAAPNVEEALDSSLQNPNRTTNVYIRGLPPDTTDASLLEICERFGPISSSKAILDAATNTCKGFGFACFVNEYDAQTCISALTHVGYQVSFAKESFSVRLKNLQDPSSTNLYLSNLPLNMKEEDLEDLFEPYKIDSCRILRDAHNVSRGVGFARMDTRQGAEEIIAKFDGKSISGEGSSGLPLQVRFADSPSQKRLKGQTQRRRQWRAREYNILTGRVGFEEMSGYMVPAAVAAAAGAAAVAAASEGNSYAAQDAMRQTEGSYGYDAGASGDTGPETTADAEPRTMPDQQAELIAKAADQAEMADEVARSFASKNEEKQGEATQSGDAAGLESVSRGMQELST